jgi:chromosome segregation ATPase
LSSQLSTAQKNASDAQAQVTSLTSQLAASQKLAADELTQINDLNTQLSASKKLAADELTQINDLSTQLSASKKLAADELTQINDLSTQLSASQKLASDKITQLASTENTLTNTKAQLATAQSNQLYIYNGLINENDQLQDKLNDMTSEFSTYEQKVVYQQQQLDNLMTVNFWMWITYYFKACMFMYYLFGVNTDMFMSTKIVLTLLAIIYPYVINIIEDYGYSIGKYVWSIINADVYSQDR